MNSLKFCQLRHLLLASYRLTNFQGKVNGKKRTTKVDLLAIYFTIALKAKIN